MQYYIAANTPAEIQSVNPAESGLYNDFFNDIMCSRWSSAFARSKALRMPAELQSQLYINAKNRFVSSRTCPAPNTVPKVAPASTPANSNQSGGANYVPSSSPIWGGVFK